MGSVLSEQGMQAHHLLSAPPTPAYNTFLLKPSFFSILKKIYMENGIGFARVGIGNTWETSVPSPQFFCASKAALKIQA